MPLESPRYKWLLTLLTLLAFSFAGVAAKGNGLLSVAGAVKELSNTLNRVKIEVLNEDMSLLHSFTSADGQFDLDFESDKIYRIRFNKHGYQSILVEVNTKKMGKEYQNEQFSMGRVMVQMFSQNPTRNMTVFDQPIIRLKFDNKTGQFVVDQKLLEKLETELDMAARATRNYYIQLSKQAAVHVDSAEQKLVMEDFTGARYFLVQAREVCEQCENVKELSSKIEIAQNNRGLSTAQLSQSKSPSNQKHLTESSIAMENKEILIRDVDDQQGHHSYYKITHQWGGTYYFKDDQPVTSWNWHDAASE